MKKTKRGTPYSITKKGMAYVYEIEGKGFGGYALTHVSKRKLSESEIDEIGSGNEYAKGGNTKRSKESIIADSRYNALPEGERKSKKWATIELANGKKNKTQKR